MGYYLNNNTSCQYSGGYVINQLSDKLIEQYEKRLLEKDNRQAIEWALEFGPLHDLKIDNMRRQHNHLHHTDKEVEDAKHSEEVKEHKKYGFISISTGDGIDEIFKSMGVDEIITGGQTMNPSTEDILNAVEKINADDIFVFPNNSNIIPAARRDDVPA